MTTVAIPVRFSDGTEATWHADVAEEPPWLIKVRSDDGTEWLGEGRDLFSCLQEVRRKLEPENVRLCVNGARGDAYPSGMSRDMGGAQMVYIFPLRGRLNLFRRRTRGKLVYLLDPAPCDLIATVSEQEENYARWVRFRR